MEKCLNCGRNIDEGLSICPYCGNSIPTVERGGEDERMNISDGEDRTLQNDPDINDFKNADAEFMFQSSQDVYKRQDYRYEFQSGRRDDSDVYQ